jgi:hypothetical protein
MLYTAHTDGPRLPMANRYDERIASPLDMHVRWRMLAGRPVYPNHKPILPHDRGHPKI